MKDDNKLISIVKRYRENKMAHAYLIETNDQEKCLKDLLEVIKNISCPKVFKTNCNECNLCNLINLNNLPTLKIIEPDGISIKKNQIQELKDNFSTKPVFSNYNIYIIKNADKLNVSSGNTMLKFLEEPDGQVLGFFITNNKDNLILTIQSRCQLLKVEYENDLQEKLNIENHEQVLSFINDYIYGIENNKKIVILKNKKIIIDIVLKSVTIEQFFKLILDIYRNAFYFKNKMENCFSKYEIFDYLLEIDANTLLKKIGLLVEYVENTNYNLNSELLLDRFVLEMSGMNE